MKVTTQRQHHLINIYR